MEHAIMQLMNTQVISIIIEIIINPLKGGLFA